MNKKFFLAGCVLLLSAINASAQKIAGLYRNQHDFVFNTLTSRQDCDAKGSSIATDLLFSSSKIVIKVNGKKNVALKKDYFGYLDCNGVAYQFFNDQAFQILDTAGFYLYKQTYLAGGKGYKKVTAYYFSKDGNGALQPFTVQNLANSFSANDKFIYALQTTFHNDAELTEYVTYLKRFKVKFIFEETVKK